MGVDFHRELGDVFSVKLTPWNRWGRFKALRERWRAHLTSSRIKPVILVDKAREMSVEVLNELRILSSADIDVGSLLTVVLAGDGRLLSPKRKRGLDMLVNSDSSLPVVRIGGIPRESRAQPWLVEQLWELEQLLKDHAVRQRLPGYASATTRY